MRYWLMKSEPDEFSIGDLSCAGERGSFWEGVRNYQARNFLREMKVGDLAFFYHSSCPQPGIVGIMRILTESEADPSQFDAGSVYHDPKSREDQPRWSGVRVGFVEECPLISLSAMRGMPELQSLPLLQKGSRLSVMPVSPVEWDGIVRMIRLRQK